MPCLLVLFSIMVPRLVLAVIFCTTNWFSQAYTGVLWPILGFVFMPYTTLAYMAAMLRNQHQVSGWWLILLIFTVLVDLGGSGSLKRYCFHGNRIDRRE